MILLVTLAATACGSTSPADQVRSAWSELKNALVAGDAGKFCARLSDQARAQLLAQVSAISPASTCEAAARTLFNVARNERARSASVKLTSVSVHGNQATTTDSSGPPPDNWVKVQGRWELATISTGS